jgi:hypothetical protein
LACVKVGTKDQKCVKYPPLVNNILLSDMEKNHYFDYVIGLCLQAARVNAKKTKKEIYTHFRIPRKTYDRYEKGESSVSIPLVLEIWMYCGVSGIKDFGDDLIGKLGRSSYGRTLLKWLPDKKED